MKIFPTLIIGAILMLLIITSALAESYSRITENGKLRISNNSYWVEWDPVGDHIAGDQFFVNGTTNFSSGMRVDYVFYTPLDCHVKYCDYSDSTIKGDVVIESGESSGINKFSILINTTGLQSNQYYFSFRILSPDSSAESADFSGFDNFVSLNSNLFPESTRDRIESDALTRPDSSGRSYWITMDHNFVSYEYPYTVPCFQITGITNLPVGDSLYYSLFLPIDSHAINGPDRTVNPIIFNVTDRNYGGKVTAGDTPGINKFILTVNTSEFSDGRDIIIWNPRYNTTDHTDSVSTTAYFSNYPAQPVKNNSITCAPLKTRGGPDSPLVSLPKPTKSSSFTFGILLSLTGAGLFVVASRKREGR
jgi:hypothetical protein